MASLPTLPPAGGHLIINADDLGADAVRDAVILALGQEGRISSASLLVTSDHAAAAAAVAAVADGLPLGLHLNLTEGRPLAGASSLTDAEGHLRGKFALREALAAGAVAASDLAREIRAQFDRFIALTGHLPSHVDGHHHIQVEALVAAVLAPIMDAEYGVYRLRLPAEVGVADALAGRPEAAFHAQVATATAAVRPVYAACHVHAPHAFIGLAHMGERLTVDGISGALATIAASHPAGEPLWVEWMVHPGSADGPAAGEDSPGDALPRDSFSPSPARAHEAAVLASGELASALAGWTRASFAEMPAPDDGRPALLVYGKLTPATGNAETARRLRDAWAPLGRVLSRPLLADPADPAALAREVRALRHLAVHERLALAFGIHVYRAGVPLAAAFAASSPAVPYGLLASGTDANDDVADPRKRAAMARVLAGADFLLCLSANLQHRLADLPCPADTQVCGNGIDVATDSAYSLRRTLELGPEQPLVLFPASLRPVKGVLAALEALAPLLAERFPAHVLVILGPALDAPYAGAVHTLLAALAARHPCPGRILHIEALPHADYLAALREANLVLNASTSEGLSHGLMEAMAAGVPVLASNIAGNRALVREGDTGRLFTDAASLCRQYTAVFAEPGQTATLAARAQAWMAATFPAAAEATLLRAAAERALARSRPPGARTQV